MENTITLTVYIDDDDSEIDVEFPSKMEVCYDCQGHGYTLRDGMRYHAYSQEEFMEEFCDDEDREQYFTRGGIYDEVCRTCKGKNVVPYVDRERVKHEPELQKMLDLWDEQEEHRAQADAEYEAEMRMERMMCGDY